MPSWPVGCNSHAYNVDSVANWLNYDWSASQNNAQRNFNSFAKSLIAFRKAHAALRPLTFYTGAQLSWWTPAGATPDSNCFNSTDNHAIAWELNDGASPIYWVEKAMYIGCADEACR